MKIKITGRGWKTAVGKAGSYEIRAVQLGAAIGAKVESESLDFSGDDLVIVVKRVTKETLAAIREAGKPWAWDIVDAWPQPEGNKWSRDQALEWLDDELRRLQPDAVVFPTDKMRQDAGFKGPSIALPHHAWEKYRPHKVTSGALTVGYEGGDYLGKWRGKLHEYCRARGWRFVENGDMQQADIGIALRFRAGYPAMNWKSNCKLANLQALGIPAICSPEAGYFECASGAEMFVETSAELAAAFDVLADAATRRRLGAQMLKAVPRLADVAARYKTWLKGMV